MSSSPLKSAKLTIELDTQDAQARLDELEEKLNELTGDIEDQDGELSKNEKRSGNIGQQREQQQGSHQPSMHNTGPGKFGLRNVPAILTASDMAGFIGGLVPIPAVGTSARKIVELEQQYGPLASGIVESMLKKFGIPDVVAKSAVQSADTVHKLIGDLDKRLKAFSPTLENTLEMAKAQIMAGGHINAKELVKFAQTSYEWEFVNQRKTQDIRDKTLRVIGEEAPNMMKELFMRAVEGKLVP